MMATRFILAFCDGVPLSERIGLHACHTCDDTKCVNPVHLYWGTQSENEQDYHKKFGRKGDKSRRMTRAALGEEHPREEPATAAPDDSDSIPF